MKICFLGTAPGLPLPERFGQTVVVTTHGGDGKPSHLLLDVGDGASSLLARNGFDHCAIQAIVISHMHGDHHGGLIQVLKSSMHLGRRDELVILAPEEGIAALQSYLDASYLYADWLGYPIRWESLAAETLQNGIELSTGMRLQSYVNDHLASARDRFAALGISDHGRSFESYSLSIEHEDVRVVYSGNLRGASGADEMTPFVEPADLLICELAHVDPTNLGRFLADKQIHQTVLAHVSPRLQGVPDSDVLSQIYAGADDAPIVGSVAIARDGETFQAINSRSIDNLVRS